MNTVHRQILFVYCALTKTQHTTIR